MKKDWRDHKDFIKSFKVSGIRHTASGLGVTLIQRAGHYPLCAATGQSAHCSRSLAPGLIFEYGKSTKRESRCAVFDNMVRTIIYDWCRLNCPLVCRVRKLLRLT